MESSAVNQNNNVGSSSAAVNTGATASHGGGTDELEATKKRGRAETSVVWQYFDKVGVGKDGKERAQCKRHLGKCKNVPKFHETEVGKLMFDQAGKLRSRKIDNKVVRDIIAMAIIEHDLPFSFTEYRRIRELLKYINPEGKAYSRRTATVDVINMYETEKEKLKQVLARVPGRICLTSDVWTSCTTEGYISLTAHFVDESWKLQSKILNFAHFPPPHSGIELAKIVFYFLREWGIERKIFSLTLDNATSNDNMQELLKDRLLLQTNGLLSGGNFFHIRCCAHILNLIVQEGLKATGGALYKIRESIKYVKGSEGRMNAFKACVQQIGDINTNVGLRLDVTTRWNSTFVMLESALAYRRAFSTLSYNDRNYKYCPSNEEWTRGHKMCEFLRPFNVITNLMSGSSYPTSNLYFMQVWKIECLLIENMNSEDEILKDMANRMKVKFDKYWRDYSVVLAFGTILDPRMKLSFLEFCYRKLDRDPVVCQAKLKVVTHKLSTLFDEYLKMSSCEKSTSSQPQLSRPREVVDANGVQDSSLWIVMDEFIEFENQNVTEVGKSQLDTYLDEQKLDLQYHQKLDVLQYWKENKNRFPDLALMACDILSIPITTVASESAFSIGSRVLNKYRSSLLPENVQALICTRNWLLGFEVQEKDEESSQTLDVNVASSASKESSNIVEDID
ncbi:hypothetical protein CASFOL_009487 [Castilleja foliolosa]|uniref:Transposase n=1 Tax=Castilleja foliolosa TaxID=1961234 RepID=A0ABD3DXG1_9LAMI